MHPVQKEKTTVTVSMDAALLDRIKTECEELDLTVSQFVRLSIRQSLGESKRPKAVLLQQMGDLLAANVSVFETLDVVIEDWSGSPFAKSLKATKKALMEGRSVWESMSMSPDVFSPLDVRLVREHEYFGRVADGVMAAALMSSCSSEGVDASLHRFFLVLEKMDECGASIDRGFEAAILTTSGETNARLSVIREALSGGYSFVDAAKDTCLLDRTSLAILRSAEECGRLGDGFGRVARHFKAKSDRI